MTVRPMINKSKSNRGRTNSTFFINTQKSRNIIRSSIIPKIGDIFLRILRVKNINSCLSQFCTNNIIYHFSVQITGIRFRQTKHISRNKTPFYLNIRRIRSINNLKRNRIGQPPIHSKIIRKCNIQSFQLIFNAPIFIIRIRRCNIITKRHRNHRNNQNSNSYFE